MASYPTAVKSYTTKVDGAGNTIAAAHINDLQAEVTAIEDGILNGTAPVNSSRITAPSLQVTASTITNLVVTTIGNTAQKYTLPSSGPSTGQVLTCISTGGSTGALEWRTPSANTAPTVVAMGRVSSAGAIANGYNLSSATIASSHYDIAFSSNLASSVYFVSVTVASASGRQRPSAYNRASSGFRVSIYDDAQTNEPIATAPFFVVVHST